VLCTHVELQGVSLYKQESGPAFSLKWTGPKGDPMKTHQWMISGSTALLVFVVAGCTATANIHDNTVNIPNAAVNFKTDADLSNVAPDQTIPIVVTVQNVYLIDPATAPPPEHVADAGHLQIYLDDVNTPPIVITANVDVDVKIPPQTPAGKHKLICRVHHHDGTPTDTKVEVNITVKVTVGATDAATSAPDASGSTMNDAAIPAG
jgi:hypothetical protein